MNRPVRVAITGAAGQIGYQLCFRIAAGDMLGPDQPVILQLLEITPALGALEGVVMELRDAAFPLLTDIIATDDAETAFEDTDYALLVGARPRGVRDRIPELTGVDRFLDLAVGTADQLPVLAVLHLLEECVRYADRVVRVLARYRQVGLAVPLGVVLLSFDGVVSLRRELGAAL